MVRGRVLKSVLLYADSSFSYLVVSPEENLQTAPNLPWWMSRPERHLSQPMKNRFLDSGHNFIVKLFDCQMRCALCTRWSCAFSLAAQCITCKLLCHTKCLGDGNLAWIPSCLNTPSPALSKDESACKLHRWVPLLNLSGNWCSHCGFPMSLGEGNHQEGPNRRCEECAKTSHAQCQLLVPSRCGFFPALPEGARQLTICKTPLMKRLMSEDDDTRPKPRQKR